MPSISTGRRQPSHEVAEFHSKKKSQDNGKVSAEAQAQVSGGEGKGSFREKRAGQKDRSRGIVQGVPRGLTRFACARTETEIEVVCGEKVLETRNHRRGDTKLERVCDLVVTDAIAEKGEVYQIHITNPSTTVCVDVKIDGEKALMPNWARRPDGSKIFKKKPQVPVFKGQTRILKGYEVEKERTVDSYNVSERLFQFEKVEYKYRPEDFPSLSGEQKPKEKHSNHAYAEEADEEKEEIFGGTIEVRVYELTQIVVQNRSQKGGEFQDERQPKVAEIGEGNKRTVPSDSVNLRSSRITSRKGDTKEQRGSLIYIQKFHYSSLHKSSRVPEASAKASKATKFVKAAEKST